MMKKFSIYIILAIISIGFANAQQVGITNAVAKKVGTTTDTLAISFSLDCNQLGVKSREQMIITPVIISRSDSDTIALPAIYVVGNNRYKMNRREGKLYGKSVYPKDAKVFRYDNKRNALFGYKTIVYTKPWMSNGRIEVLRDLEGCVGCGMTLGNALLAELPEFVKKVEVPKVKRPDLEILLAKPEEKRRSFTRSAYFNFRVNQTILLADYMNNAAELNKMYASIDSIRNDKNYRMDAIRVVGYASPEGNYAHNARLSEARAKALENNLKQAYRANDINIYSSSVAENWEGLRQWLLKYKPSYMQRVIDIIDNTPNPDARDAKIRAIDGGRTYNALLKEVYPLLRLAEYTVNYVIIPFDVQEGREMIVRRPDTMNHYEMYQVALSYGKGSDEYNRIVRMIADRMPEDKIAQNNAAIIAWEMGDYDAMREYLKKLSEK